MYDSHIHTNISFDSEMNVKEAIEALKEKNCGGIFTEHYDLGYPEEGQFLFEPPSYFKEYACYRNDRLLLGIELGMVPGRRQEADAIIEPYPFDYVIGSIHVVENMDIYYPEYFQGRSKLESYQAYFQAMETCIREYDFDALGHIDYISRYAPYKDPNVWAEEELKASLKGILKLLVESGRVLEFNTRKITCKEDYERVLPIYKLYKDLGGAYVTIGSDAHTPEGIGWKCREAQKVLADIGLKTVYFVKRKRLFLDDAID
jgi:histidinol-phosphatase (PHP family)